MSIDTAATSAARYDIKTIRYHWISAVLVLGLWVVGQTIDDFARGTPRTAARSAHIVTGVLLALVVIARVAWRAREGTKLPPASTGPADLLARTVHGMLYLLLLSTVVLGIANAWIRGDMILGLGRIPSVAPGNKELKETVENLHALSANAIVSVAGLHAAAGLFHQFVLRDRLLLRMMPERKPR